MMALMPLVDQIVTNIDQKQKQIQTDIQKE